MSYKVVRRSKSKQFRFGNSGRIRPKVIELAESDQLETKFDQLWPMVPRCGPNLRPFSANGQPWQNSSQSWAQVKQRWPGYVASCVGLVQQRTPRSWTPARVQHVCVCVCACPARRAGCERAEQLNDAQHHAPQLVLLTCRSCGARAPLGATFRHCSGAAEGPLARATGAPLSRNSELRPERATRNAQGSETDRKTRAGFSPGRPLVADPTRQRLAWERERRNIKKRRTPAPQAPTAKTRKRSQRTKNNFRDPLARRPDSPETSDRSTRTSQLGLPPSAPPAPRRNGIGPARFRAPRAASPVWIACPSRHPCRAALAD